MRRHASAPFTDDQGDDSVYRAAQTTWSPAHPHRQKGQSFHWEEQLHCRVKCSSGSLTTWKWTSDDIIAIVLELCFFDAFEMDQSFGSFDCLWLLATLKNSLGFVKDLYNHTKLLHGFPRILFWSICSICVIRFYLLCLYVLHALKQFFIRKAAYQHQCPAVDVFFNWSLAVFLILHCAL